MFNSLFGGFVRPVTLSLSIATLAIVSGCASIGAATGVKGTGGSDRQAIAAAVGSALGDLIARDLGRQAQNRQTQQGQVVAKSQMVEAKDCTSIGGQLERLNGQVVCHIRSGSALHNPVNTTANTGFCLYKIGWSNDQFTGIRKGPQSASDQLVGRVARDFPAGEGQIVKPCI